MKSILRDAPSRVAISKWLSGDSLPEVKRLFQIIGKSVQWMLTGEDSNLEEFSDQIGMVPVISWVQAGSVLQQRRYPATRGSGRVDPQPGPGRRPRRYAVRVKGDSMVSRDGGRSYPGTVLIVDPDVDPESWQTRCGPDRR